MIIKIVISLAFMEASPTYYYYYLFFYFLNMFYKLHIFSGTFKTRLE